MLQSFYGVSMSNVCAWLQTIVTKGKTQIHCDLVHNFENSPHKFTIIDSCAASKSGHEVLVQFDGC